MMVSDVALVMRNDFYDSLCKSLGDDVKLLFEEADHVQGNGEDILFQWESINWRMESSDHKCYNLMKRIKEMEEDNPYVDESYYMLVLSSELAYDYAPIDTYGTYFESGLHPYVKMGINIG